MLPRQSSICILDKTVLQADSRAVMYASTHEDSFIFPETGSVAQKLCLKHR